ncbi:hypothetical protein [Actinoalloteichus hymeniacidonis]|uniref:Uncharacterized protein n=1 Tax=Actinoalloteichus hymeniacidonis TaxID=340345 RepID=A0AAC9MZT1_9PSEU|nr:hypothetical protein [Actinoalloteichus hymeniacidonis]AOS64784.1 hypothetical protein TL08_19965 [Actinoalloteichus hymeniacidonis]MBB5907141.1 hypothetical protein [Actinoalloteichus hymeniacidonis]
MDRGDWPVVVTDRCARSCAEALGFADQDSARAWLTEQIRVNGTITDRLPASVVGRRSRSGYFLVIKDEVLLPLAEDRDGAPQWIGTNCVIFPERRRPSAAPLTLSGAGLLDQIELLPHAVERFQQYCGGSTDIDVARRELRARLAPTARAASRAPRWSGTRPAEFYLVAGQDDEYVLPCRTGGGGRPFDATTCIHRSRDLFELAGRRLIARCRVDAVPARRRARLTSGLGVVQARLEWNRPSWAPVRRDARWWVVLAPKLAIPVAWEPENRRRPLVALGVVDRRSMVIRVWEWLRDRLTPNPPTARQEPRKHPGARSAASRARTGGRAGRRTGRAAGKRAGRRRA